MMNTTKMSSNKTQEHAAVEKPQSKPGRKPLTSEPKNKRTAQNRAAQRAFRERKERRMKDLEDKVAELEKEKMQIANESELLRSQVSTLMKQLNEAIDGTSSSIGSSISPLENKLFSVSNPISNSYIRNYSSTNDETTSSTNNSHTHLSSNGSISSATPLSYFGDDSLKLTPIEHNFDANLNLSLKNKLNNTDFKDHYDEQVFCNELGQACGSKGCPIPKAKTTLSSIPSSTSSPSGLTGCRSVQTQSSQTNSVYGGSTVEDDFLSNVIPDKKSTKDTLNPEWNFDFEPAELSKQNEMNFLFNDNSKALETGKLIESNPQAFQVDPSSALFTENQDDQFDFDFDVNNEDLFEDLLKLPQDEEKVDRPVNNKQNSNAGLFATDLASDNEEVPDNSKDLLKCSQIWERITTHPRFTELDIDNLCDELKQKAKCSETGVVVDGNQVGQLLQDAMKEKQQVTQNEKDLEMKKLALTSTSSNSFLQGLW